MCNINKENLKINSIEIDSVLGEDMVIKRLNKFYAFYIFFLIQLLFGVIVPLHVMASGVDLEALEEVEEETKTIEESDIIGLEEAIMSRNLEVVQKAIKNGAKTFRRRYGHWICTPIGLAVQRGCDLNILQALHESGIDNAHIEKYPEYDLLDWCLRFPIKSDKSGERGKIKISCPVERAGCVEKIEFFLKSGVQPEEGFVDSLVKRCQYSLQNDDLGEVQKKVAAKNYATIFEMLMKSQDKGTRDKAIDAFERLKPEEQKLLNAITPLQSTISETIAERTPIGIHGAIFDRDFIALKKAIARGDRKFSMRYLSFTPIGFAIRQGCGLDIIQLLYESGVEDEFVNKNEEYDLLDWCLSYASMEGRLGSLFCGVDTGNFVDTIEFLLRSGMLPKEDFAGNLISKWRLYLGESAYGLVQKQLANQNCAAVFEMLMRGRNRGVRDKAIDLFKHLKQEEQRLLKPYISFDNDYRDMLAFVAGSSVTGLYRSIVLEIAKFLVGECVADPHILPVCRVENRVEERRLLGRPSASLLASVALIKRCEKDEKRGQEEVAAKEIVKQVLGSSFIDFECDQSVDGEEKEAAENEQLLEVETSYNFLMPNQGLESRLTERSMSAAYQGLGSCLPVGRSGFLPSHILSLMSLKD